VVGTCAGHLFFIDKPVENGNKNKNIPLNPQVRRALIACGLRLNASATRLPVDVVSTAQ
jgi:hypothetical protein